MKTLTFLSQKGGSGKTTLAVHMAIAANEAGERVVLVDTDPQKTATAWSDVRKKESPIVATVAPSGLHNVLDAAKNEHISLAIIDTAPHAAPDAVRVVQAVDLVVIPCRPTAFDLAAVASAVDIVKAAPNAKAVFVLSACPFRSPEIEETRQVLSGYGFDVCPSIVTDRRAFARAVASGRGVTEFENDGKAAIEIRALWKWLKGRMK
jgi:chromosome partitioning protein